MASLREDEISKRIFYAGMFGLPWLWLVHSMGYYANQRGDGSLENGRDSGNPEAATIASNQYMWVQRCRNLACLGTFVWLVWIIVVQFLMPGVLPQALYVRLPDEGDYTGW